MKEACSDTSSEIRDIAIPQGLSADVKAKAREALNTCSNAYAAKWLAADKSMEILDGDFRPSKMREAKQLATAAGSGVVMCTAGLMTTAVAGGVELKDLR